MSVPGKLARLAAAIVPALPFRAASGLGGALGTCAWAIDARHRRVASANLARALPQAPERERRLLVRRSFQQAGRTALEMLWSRSLDARRLERIATFEGLDHVERALGQRRGLILISAHFGNWELMGVALGLVGIPMNVVARKMPDEDLERVLDGCRTHTGTNVIHKEQAVRSSLKAIRDNQVVGVLIDQNTLRPHASFVPFFGVEAATTRIAGQLHARTLAPMVTAFAVPNKRGYRFVIEPLEIEPDELSTEEMARRVTVAATERIEAYVRDHPEAWLWIDDRWRTRPEDAGGDDCVVDVDDVGPTEVVAEASREAATE